MQEELEAPTTWGSASGSYFADGSEFRVSQLPAEGLVEQGFFQSLQRRELLLLIQLTVASGVFPEDVVDVFEGLFEHETWS
jgi:hypothetical protein